MAEITVGTWNALNSFGDERMGDALDVVGCMDADVVYLCEMTLRSAGGEQLSSAQDRMRQLGYNTFDVSNYSPYENVRDEQTMGMFSRVEGDISKLPIGRRWGMKLVLPNKRMTVYGHQDTDLLHYATERAETADSVVEDWQKQGGEAIDLGDKNGMYAHGPNASLPRRLGKLGVPAALRALANMRQESDYYDDNKPLKRLAGKVIRVIEMADETMQRYAAAGFHNADPDNSPTIGTGRLAIAIDHIQGTPGVAFDGFRHIQKSRELSDHTAIVARATY